jgi:arylsulfatase A-like enzyme
MPIVRVCSVALAAMLVFFSGQGFAKNQPNIVFMLVDNFGYGDLGSYGGGEIRGVPTPKLDRLAAQGMRLTNFNVEPECTPSRSALLTGRMPIRSGTSAVDIMGGLQGMTPWEYTLAELLADAGYLTAAYGKWHLGDVQGRFPNDQGFDQWYGFPHSSNAPLRELQPGYDAELAGPEGLYEGTKGEKSRRVGDYDLAMRRRFDREVTDRAIGFIAKNADSDQPFFLYLPYSLPHSPPLPHPDFDRRGYSDYQNVLAEIDHNAGRVIDAVDKAGIAEDTIVIFASDNGPETMAGIGIQYGGQSDSGPFRGEFPSAWEGAIRVPAIVRWPGRTQPGRVSNEVISILDFYSSLATVAGGANRVPSDRPIDSIDQSDFLFGKQQKSNREHLMIFHGQDLLAVKWRNYKIHFQVRMPSTGPVVQAGQGVLTSIHQRLGIPYIFDLENDPKELWNINAANNWLVPVLAPILKDYGVSTKQHPNLKPGAQGPTTLK